MGAAGAGGNRSPPAIILPPLRGSAEAAWRTPAFDAGALKRVNFDVLGHASRLFKTGPYGTYRDQLAVCEKSPSSSSYVSLADHEAVTTDLHPHLFQGGLAHVARAVYPEIAVEAQGPVAAGRGRHATRSSCLSFSSRTVARDVDVDQGLALEVIVLVEVCGKFGDHDVDEGRAMVDSSHSLETKLATSIQYAKPRRQVESQQSKSRRPREGQDRTRTRTHSSHRRVWRS